MKVACPKCGANIVFLPEKQICFCEHCKSEINPKDYFTKEYDVQSGNITWDECSCSSCGARLIVDEFTTISRCVYCGSTQIIKSRFQGSFKPDSIIPFEISIKSFLNKYQHFIDSKKYVPYDFTQEYILDDIKGLYVPMYLFEYQIKIENDLYQKEKFSILLDGASKIQDRLMKDLEPFDKTKLTEFHPMYLCGFVAQNGDETETWLSKKAKYLRQNKVKRYVNLLAKSYSTNQEKLKVTPVLVSKKYYLYPVWFFHTTYEGKKYFFAVNGQTGKVVGNVPIDKKAFYIELMMKVIFIGIFLFGLIKLLNVLFIVSISAFSTFPILLLFFTIKALNSINEHWFQQLLKRIYRRTKKRGTSQWDIEIEELEKIDDDKR